MVSSIQSLYLTCAGGHIDDLKSLLATGTDINVDGSDVPSNDVSEPHIKPGPLLHIAACYNQPEVVEYLIAAGANVHQTSRVYGSVLIAALEGVLAPILRKKSPKDHKQAAQELPRSEQVHKGTSQEDEISACQRIVDSLLAAGAQSDPGDRMRPFGDALHLAAYLGSETIVISLIEHDDEDLNTFGGFDGYLGSALHAAQRGCHASTMQVLLDLGADVNYCVPSYGYVIHRALEHGSLDDVNQLLARRADLNAYEEKHGSTFLALMRRVNRAEDMNDDHHQEGSNDDDHAVVDLVLNAMPPVQIRPCDLPYAVQLPASVDPGRMVSKFLYSNDRSGAPQRQRKVLEALLDRTAPSGLSESSLVELIGLLHEEQAHLLQRLLDRTGSLGITPAMLKAVRDPKLTTLLLRRRPICAISTDIFEAATRRLPHGFAMHLLLERGWDVPVTPDLIMTVLEWEDTYPSDPKLLERLLDRSTDKTVTDEMIAVTKNADVLNILLERRKTQPSS